MAACFNLGRKYWKYTALLLFISMTVTFFLLEHRSEPLSRKPEVLIQKDSIQPGEHVLHQNDNNEIPTHRDKQENSHMDFKFRTTLDNAAMRSIENVNAVPNTEVRHIGFLKVHKAASSTMQNMFYRFGLKRNLTFVFTEHPNYFSRTYESHIPLVKPTRRSGYDILCNHGVFNYDIYSSLLPNDTVYIGIVRDPLAVFISAVNYYTQPSQLIRYLGMVPGNKLQNLIRKPEVYDKGFFTYTKNVMARDFGFSPSKNGVQEKLKQLDGQFKLVILVEYFEESLILMKRYLRWKLQDILFISNNVYGKGSTVADLTPSDIELFKQRNALDNAVYNFFYERFWKQFEKESDDIHNEVLHYKNALQLVYTFCKQQGVAGPLIIPESAWNQPVTVTREDCKYMTLGELEFIKYLRTLQGSELRKKKPVILRKGLVRGIH